MDGMIKETLAKKKLEMQNEVEKPKKIHVHLKNTAIGKFKMKYGLLQDLERSNESPQGRSIRMYETHNPGFCYLRNGECRKRGINNYSSSSTDPIECSEKLKSILFTNNELDVNKTVCLHLLGTHVQSRSHIQSKDGRLCSYVKAQAVGNTNHAVRSNFQKLGFVTKEGLKFEKMLPRYVLDVKVLNRGRSLSSIKLADWDSGSDEDTKKKRKLLVPIYINNEIKTIICSVMEALEAIQSPKLKAIIDLASGPEELRNLLNIEDIKQFIAELSAKPFILKPSSYDPVMAHVMFDKIPEKGTLEPVAQVLEIYDNLSLYDSLYQIRKTILRGRSAITKLNFPLARKKTAMYDDFVLSNYNLTNKPAKGYSKFGANTSVVERAPKDNEKIQSPMEEKNSKVILKNQKQESNLSVPSSSKQSSKNQKPDTSDNLSETLTKGSISSEDSKGSFLQSRSSTESYKHSFQNLNNPQRILLGLKVASLKCKPIHLHQYEGKKKMDLPAIIASVSSPNESEINAKLSSDDSLSNFTAQSRKTNKLRSQLLGSYIFDFENLSRAQLAHFRLEISENENKKRVNQFIAKLH